MMVLAFYYVWFDPYSGRWDVALDTPLIGRYSSTDRKVILKHCEWAKEGGIDGFVISLWKEERFGGIEKVKRVTEVLEECGLKYTFYLENGDPVKRVREVLREFGGRRNLIRINGKPLIFVYSRITGIMDMSQRWALMDLSDSVLLSLHGFYGLNGFTSGNMHVYIDFKMGWEEAREVCDYTHAFGGLCALPVSPGFDLRTKPHQKVPRKDGFTYIQQWRRAIESGADIVLITSFNEWEEGTHVEPSKRYGYEYLKLTRRMANLFKRKVKPRVPTYAPPGLKTHLKLCMMMMHRGIIPAYMITPVSLLLLPVSEVRRGRYDGCDAVIYDHWEFYDPSSVPALLEYVQKGGTLILAGGPYPMYRNLWGEEKPAVRKFGLRIGFGPNLKGEWGGEVTVEGKRRSYRYYPMGDTRLRTLENPDRRRFILRRGAENLGTVVGEKRFGRGRVIFLWKGISEQPYLPTVLRDILSR